jgi:hypothetical protein
MPSRRLHSGCGLYADPPKRALRNDRNPSLIVSAPQVTELRNTWTMLPSARATMLV